MPMALSVLSSSPPFMNRDGYVNLRLTFSGTYTGDPINIQALGIVNLTPTEFSKLLIPRVAGAADGKDFAIGNTLTITGVTTANPGVVTTAEPHTLQTGDAVVIAGVVGATQANATTVATVLTATTFSIPINVSGTYSEGGAVTATPSMRWAGVARLYTRGTSTESSSTVATTVDLPIIWRKSVVVA